MAVISSVIAVSALHYVTPPPLVPWHTLFLRFYYLPILLAALEFGWKGGLGTALFSGVICYAPHVTAWRDFPGYTEYSQYGEIVVFALVGTITGLLAARGKERTQELHQRTLQLRNAHQRLRDNFEQLKRADRLAATGRLAAGLASEMERPLAAIERAIRELEVEPRAVAGRERATDRIRCECRKWDRLLTQVLDFARPRETAVHRVSISKIVDSVASLLAPIAQSRAIPLLKVVDRELPLIECKQEYIEQALLNVAMSATEAVECDAVVTLAACRKRAGVSLEVRTDCRGMESDGDATTSDSNADGPLGLFVAEQIMKDHGGMLEIDESDKDARVISLYLPIPVAN